MCVFLVTADDILKTVVREVSTRARGVRLLGPRHAARRHARRARRSRTMHLNRSHLCCVTNVRAYTWVDPKNRNRHVSPSSPMSLVLCRAQRCTSTVVVAPAARGQHS